MKSFFFKVALSFAVVGAVVACSKSEIEEIAPMQPSTDDIAQEGEVRIAVPEGTRSTLVDNGVGGTDLRWTSGDKITILAYDSNNSNIIIMPAEEFELVGNKYNGRGAYFRAYPDLDDMAPEATYNYYAISPALNENNEDILELNGTNLSFKIPEKQDGRFRTDLDLMIAKAAGKPALEACEVERNEDGTVKDSTKPINDIGLMFYHRTHMLRFSIPDGVTNNLSDSGIKKVYLIFPDKVAGTMNVNMADDVTYDDNSGITSPVPTFSNTSNKIVVEFSSPKKAGDEFWVMTFPYAGGLQNVDIRFEDKDGNISERRKISFTNMAANRITPVNVANIPQATGVTSFYYTVGTNNLGEDLWSMNLKLPNGYYFTDFEQIYKAKPEGDSKKCAFSVFNDMLDGVNNQNLQFELESEHALIPQAFNISLTAGEVKDLGKKNVPYLLEENFSGIGNFSDGHDAPSIGWNSDSWVGITDLSTKSNSLAGWYAARIGCSNEAIRICCRYENVLDFGKAYYKGRLYLPFLSYIKEGKSVEVAVSFRYGVTREENAELKNTGSWFSPNYVYVYPNENLLLYFGVDNTNQRAEVKNPDDVNYGFIMGGYGNQAPGDITASINGEEFSDLGSSYTNFAGTRTPTVSGVTNSTRLAWAVSTTMTKANTNGNYWLYLDDIKISIMSR